MAKEEPKRITIANTKSRLIVFYDRLGVNDFNNGPNGVGVISSTVFSRYSRIEVTIVDWSNANNEKANVVKCNVSPINILTIAEMVLAGDTASFQKQDKRTKAYGHFEQKIDPNKTDANGYSPVTKFNIRYQEEMDSPWTITIENGVGVVERTSIGGVNIKAGSYKKGLSSSIYLSGFEMKNKMTELHQYIDTFEKSYFPYMIRKREEYIKAQEEKNSKS